VEQLGEVRDHLSAEPTGQSRGCENVPWTCSRPDRRSPGRRRFLHSASQE